MIKVQESEPQPDTEQRCRRSAAFIISHLVGLPALPPEHWPEDQLNWLTGFLEHEDHRASAVRWSLAWLGEDAA
jgi:hypothetical protein